MYYITTKYKLIISTQLVKYKKYFACISPFIIHHFTTKYNLLISNQGRRGRDRIIVGFTIAISAYHH